MSYLDSMKITQLIILSSLLPLFYSFSASAIFYTAPYACAPVGRHRPNLAQHVFVVVSNEERLITIEEIDSRKALPPHLSPAADAQLMRVEAFDGAQRFERKFHVMGQAGYGIEVLVQKKWRGPFDRSDISPFQLSFRSFQSVKNNQPAVFSFTCTRNVM